MHDHVRKSDHSDQTRQHLHKTKTRHPFWKEQLITANISRSNGVNGHRSATNHSVPVSQPPEMIPDANLNRDALAELRRHYLLPQPEHKPNVPQSVNHCGCCHDFTMGGNDHFEAHTYHPSPSELSRKRWDREGSYSPEFS
jgi:hypothetical protein